MLRRFTLITLALTAVVAFLVGAIVAGGVARSSIAAGPVQKASDSRPALKAPIIADQVNADNAKDKAKALSDEMDRDLQAAIEARDKGK